MQFFLTCCFAFSFLSFLLCRTRLLLRSLALLRRLHKQKVVSCLFLYKKVAKGNKQKQIGLP